MAASKETNVSDSRTVYTPPAVVRMTDLKEGVGICATQGSGDTTRCTPAGNSATNGGCDAGTSGVY